MTRPAIDHEPKAFPALTAMVTLQVTCQCGDLSLHEIECEEDDLGTWSAALEDRFILCETCDRLIDAGLQITVGAPE